MSTFNLKENLNDVYNNLKKIDLLRRNGSIESRLDIESNSYRDVYFDKDNYYKKEDIDRILDESIFVLSQVDKINVEDSKEMLGKIKDIYNILNSFGRNKIDGYYTNSYISRNLEEGKFKLNISTSSSLRRDLLDILSDIHFVPTKALTEEENQKILSGCEETLYQIKLNTLSTLIGHEKNGRIELYTEKENPSLYNLIESEFNTGKVSQPVSEILSEPLKFAENYTPIEIKALASIKSAPKLYRKKLKSALAQVKKEKFRRKVDNATAGLKSKAVLAVVVPVIAGAMLGLGHHGGTYLYKNYQEEKDVAKIECNIEEIADFNDFKFSAINVEKSEMDNSYFVEVYGFGKKEKGDDPKLYNIVYKVDKDIYKDYYKYFDVEFKTSEENEIENVENLMKEDLNIIQKIKADRAKWDTVSEIADVTMDEPESINLVNDVQEKE